MALSLFCFSALVFGLVAAQTAEQADKKKSPAPLPPVFSKPVPATVEELREIEQQVQKVVAKVTPAVVNLRIGPAQGSGVIVREDGLILTAGHVSGAPNRKATVVFPDDKKLEGTTLGQYKDIDSGMVKINAKGKYPFLEMGKSSELKKGQWVVAIGHPGGFRANRTPVVRVGRILEVTKFLIQTDCALVGGDSGGPLFDMQGRVIGIHSRIGSEFITQNVHVPIDTYHETFAKLERGDSWGVGLGNVPIVPALPGKEVFKKADSLNKDDATILAPDDKNKGTPEAEAKQSHFKAYKFRMKAGSTYAIDMLAAKSFFKKKKADNILDPFLRLESPEGKVLAEDDDGAGNMDSRIIFKCIKEGDYRIVATSFEGEQTGSFTIKIIEADFKDSLVSGEVDLLKAIQLPAPHLSQFFDKFKSPKADIKPFVNAILLDSKGDPIANKEISLTWEKGAKKLKSDNQGVIRWPFTQDKSRNAKLQIPDGLHALIALTDADGKSLGLTSAEKVKSAGGKIVQTFDGNLKKTDPFDFEKDKCVRHIHEFKMQAGKTYTIDLASDDFDAYLRLEDADGNKLAEDDDGAGLANSRIVHAAKDAAKVRIVVTTCYPGELGQYRVTIREADTMPAESKKGEKK